jgi:hypothetical protein
MPLPPLSLAVVGADYPNKGKSPARRFELAICQRGECVELRPEPKNLADEYAVAVYSCRGIQIGYLSAERAPRIGQIIRQGVEVRAVLQEHTPFGAVIRAAFNGGDPELPPLRESQPEPDWWPDEEWPDFP